jgi:23S rRNA pseudouridine1911/1915/1917 synthase
VGDEVYGRKHSSIPLGRHFLHAYRLSVILPGEKEPRLFEAPLPSELEQALSQLR